MSRWWGLAAGRQAACKGALRPETVGGKPASTRGWPTASPLHRLCCSHFARYILHDWADAEAAAILRTVRAAVPRGAEGCTTLLVQDAVMPERQPGTLFTTFDLQVGCVCLRCSTLHLPCLGTDSFSPIPSLTLQMLAITGGKERMLGEWSALLGAGGWHLVRVWPLRAATSLIEARPV